VAQILARRTAEGVIVSREAMLERDGKGFDIMMGVVLP